MIHKAEDSVSISTDRTAFIWDIRYETAEHRRIQKK